MIKIMDRPIMSFEADKFLPGEGIKGFVWKDGKVSLEIAHEYSLTCIDSASPEEMSMKYLIFTETTIEDLRSIVQAYDEKMRNDKDSI